MAARASQTWIVASGAVLVVLAALPGVFLVLRAVAVGAGPAVEVLASPHTWLALLRSLGLGLAVAIGCVALSLPLAWLTHATDLPGRRAFRVLLILPLAVPSYVSGFVVLLSFAPGGWLPLFDVYGAPGAFLALLFTYPFALLTIQAALERLDPRLWESARSLGARPFAVFRRVIAPQLRPAMAGGALLTALYTVGDFGAVSLLRFESLSYLVYLRYRSLFEADQAAALSLLLAAVSAVLVVFFARAGGRVHRALGSQQRPWPTIHLGSGRWPAFAFCAAVVGAMVVTPIAVVTVWLARGLRLGHELVLPAREAMTTLLLGAAAALLVVAVAFVPTLLRRLAPGRGGGFVSLVTHLGYALPAIVVALAVATVATAWIHALYQTLALLLFAYVLRFFPLAVHAIDDAVGGQSPAVVWAARSLGATPARAFVRVILPAARPAVAAGLLAVFLATIKELPITLILSPIGLGTLATRIWSLTEDAYFAAAAPSVLLLLLFAVAGLLLRPRTRMRGPS
jgi:iron(III) transport system permease protein